MNIAKNHYGHELSGSAKVLELPIDTTTTSSKLWPNNAIAISMLGCDETYSYHQTINAFLNTDIKINKIQVCRQNLMNKVHWIQVSVF